MKTSANLAIFFFLTAIFIRVLLFLFRIGLYILFEMPE